MTSMQMARAERPSIRPLTEAEIEAVVGATADLVYEASDWQGANSYMMGLAGGTSYSIEYPEYFGGYCTFFQCAYTPFHFRQQHYEAPDGGYRVYVDDESQRIYSVPWTKYS